MIDRLGKGYVQLKCDECNTESGEEFPRTEFTAMIETGRESGWRIKPTAPGEFAHICPDCADEG